MFLKINGQIQIVSDYKQIQMLDNLDNVAQSNALDLPKDWNYPKNQKSIFPVMDLVVNTAWKHIKRNTFLQKHKKQYSSHRIICLINQVNEMHFNRGIQKNSKQQQYLQPKPLLIDSLMPISADLNSENPFRNLVDKPSSIDQRVIKTNTKDRQKGILKKIDAIKLDNIVQPQQQDDATKLLRKKHQQKSAQLLSERKSAQKKARFKQQQIKAKKNQKQEKFCYDYNGQMIQVKLENKANLISKLINGRTNNESKINKPIRDSLPTKLEGTKTGKKQQKLVGAINAKKKDDVQFSDVKSLAENIKATEGVKYIHEGKTFQAKKKIIPPLQLKKTLSQRRLSRDQFKQLKELRGNHQNFDDTVLPSAKETNNKHQRSQSEAKLPTSRMTSKSKEIITINDSRLRLKMLEKSNRLDFPPQRQIEVQSVLSTIERLGTIDNYNLQYMRTGGSVDVNFANQLTNRSDNNHLPKINHQVVFSKILPKGRQRRKDTHQILRQVRKKFQEKLRV